MLSRAAVLLRAWREGEGLSQNAIARRLGTDRDTYVRWELGGGLPKVRFAVAIEDLTGIAVRWWLEPQRAAEVAS